MRENIPGEEARRKQCGQVGKRRKKYVHINEKREREKEEEKQAGMDGERENRCVSDEQYKEWSGEEKMERTQVS